MLKTHQLALFSSLLLGACTPRPAIVPSDFAAIDLAPMILAEAEPAVRDSCEQSVRRALRRHGFLMDPAGAHVEIEVSFWQDSGPGSLPAGDSSDSGAWIGAGAAATPAAHRSRSTADFTAIVHVGASKREVLTSGNADDIEPVQNAGPTGGRARSAACAIAAERFADALAEVMTNAPR